MSEVVELLVELIRNACVNDGTPDSGNEIVSVRTLQAFLGAPGTVVEPHPGRASLVYRVPGRSPSAPALCLLPHLDVVPASEEEWTHPPFGGTRAGGFVWGRGAVDMLNVTAAMAAAFRPYLEGRLPSLPGDLVFAAVADEEAGGTFGAHHLVEEHWAQVRCDYLLTEVAAPAFPSPAGPVVPVTVAEKGPAWRRLWRRGTAGHASQPHATDNALVPVAAAVERLGTAPSPVRITPEWRRLVAGLPLDADLRRRLVDPDHVDAAIDDLASVDLPLARWAHALTHMTVAPTTFQAGTKANVVPALAEADVDVRILPGQDQADVDDHFRKVLGPAGLEDIEVEPVLDFPATASQPSGPLWEAIGDAVESATGTRRLVASMTPVGTDARFFRARGVTAYGVGLFDGTVSFGEMLEMFHGANERVSERSVEATATLLADVLASFGRRTGGGE